MPYEILINSDVKPYETVMSLLAESDCNLHWWSDPAPAIDTPFEIIQGIYSYGHGHVGREVLMRMPQLRIVSNFGVGCDHIDQEAAKELGIPVGNTPGVLDATTADLTFALLLAAARNITVGDRFSRGPEFQRYDAANLLGQQVTGGVLGIVGLGRIGYQVARRAVGFDMEILYHNRNRNERAERDLGVRYVSLDKLLRASDFVALNMPLTDDTRSMIGTRELGLMKPTAVLVNAARGAVLDQEALLDALREQRLHAAAIDVTDPEPLPRDHPLLGMENLVILPHLGSATRQTRDDMATMSVNNLMAGLRGEEVPYRIT
ncbi:MAG: D-glycerate dehydrogenase [Candidatus Latescibacterota bacterium]|nr:D-glycerate dehydrogenase [Candidatus Latescibacterota bacterium]